MRIHLKSAIYVRLLATYFILFTGLCLAFAFVQLRQILEHSQAQQEHEMENKVEQLVWVLDDKFASMDRIGTLLSQMDWVRRVRSQSEIILRNIDMLRRQEICREMNIYHATIRVARSTALILPHRNTIIDSVTFWDAGNYFISIDRRGKDMAALVEDLPGISLTIRRPEESRGNNNNFFVLKQLSYAQEPELVLFVYVDGDVFAHMIRQSIQGRYINFAIYSGDAVIFSSAGAVPDGSQLYFFSAQSALFPWEYHFELPAAPTGLFIPGLVFFAAMASILLGGVISLLLSRMSYAPIKELLSRLGIKTSSQEIASIEKVFLSLKEEKQDFEMLSQRHYNIVGKNLLIILLNGHEPVSQALLQDYGLGLSDETTHSVALLLYQDRVSEEDRLLHYTQIQAVFPYCLELANQNIVLILENGEDVRQVIDGISAGGMDIYLGGPYKGLEGISQSYQDAKKQLVSEYTSDEAEASTEIGDQIVAYVNENIYDANLSQQSIAIYFGLSRPMVSKLFKKAAKTNFFDYVHEKRITKAKTCFEKGMESIMEVAEASGYANEITFRRAFMRTENTTPRGYLQSIKKMKT